MLGYINLYHMHGENNNVYASGKIVGNNDKGYMTLSCKNILESSKGDYYFILVNPKNMKWKIVCKIEPGENCVGQKLELIDLCDYVCGYVVLAMDHNIKFVCMGNVDGLEVNHNKVKAMLKMQKIGDAYSKPFEGKTIVQVENEPMRTSLKTVLIDTDKQSKENAERTISDDKNARIRETVIVSAPEKNGIMHHEKNNKDNYIGDKNVGLPPMVEINKSAKKPMFEKSDMVNDMFDTKHSDSGKKYVKKIAKAENTQLNIVEGVDSTLEQKNKTLKTTNTNIKDINLPDEISELLKDVKGQISNRGCEAINPFPNKWQGNWWKIDYADKNWHYIVGRVVIGEKNIYTLGVPAPNTPNPPKWLSGFTLYMMSDKGIGYWLLFQDEETGKQIDIG